MLVTNASFIGKPVFVLQVYNSEISHKMLNQKHSWSIDRLANKARICHEQKS